MPDFGITEALAGALKASRGVEVMRPAEIKMAQAAARAAPPASAPIVPGAPPATPSGRPVARMGAPPPAAAPVEPGAPPVPTAPPPADPAAVAPGAPTSAAPSSVTDAMPATPVAPEAPVAPPAAPPAAPDAVAPANRPLPPPQAPPAPEPVTTAARSVSASYEDATRFVNANMGDFDGKMNMTHMPNVDVMESPDKVKATILQVADDNKNLIEQARGGTVSDEQLIGLAQDLSINQDAARAALATEFGEDPARLASVALASRMIEQHQAGQLLSVSARIADNAATNADFVLFRQLSESFANYRAQLSGAAAVSGRTQRAFGIKVGLPNELPNEVLDHISSVLQRDDPNMQATAAAIRLAGSPAGIANIIGGMADIPVWKRLGMATGGLLQRVFINGILSGPPTWAKIIFGNNLNLAVHQADLFTAGIGRQLTGWATHMGEYPTAEQGAALGDAIAHMHGVMSGFADAFRVAGRVLRTGQSMDQMMRAGEGASAAGRGTLAATFPEAQDSWLGTIIRGMDRVIDFPGHLIGAMDDFTKTLGYRGYVTMMTMKELRARAAAGSLRPGDAEQVMQDMMRNPSPEMQQAAEDWAHRITFQSPFTPGGPGEAFQNFLVKAPPFRFIFPFMRTATNILKQSDVERTPLAILSSRLRAQIANGGFEGDLAKSRIATGTALAGMYAWMAVNDRITGTAPKDSKERAAWALDGRKPNSVRITNPITGQDSWHDYAWFEPMATVASTVADVVALHSYIAATGDADSMSTHETQVNQIAAHIVASIIENAGNKTYMQGAAAFSEMYNDPERGLKMWSNDMGANMQPYSGLTKFARNEQDPYLRQANSLMENLRNQMPTFGGIKGSKTLPASLDIFGEPRTTRTGNAILGPLNPLPGSDAKGDEVTDEIKDLMHQTRTVPLTMPSRQLAYLGSGQGLQDGQGMKLTAEEYSDYVRMSRAEPVFNNGKQTFRERLEQTIASPAYQSATPANRVEFIKNIQHNADKLGAQKLWNENDDFRERMTEWTAEMNRQKYNR